MRFEYNRNLVFAKDFKFNFLKLWIKYLQCVKHVHVLWVSKYNQHQLHQG